MNDEEIMKNHWLTQCQKVAWKEYTGKMHFDPNRLSNGIIQSWYPFLSHIQNPHAAREMTLLLENQRIYNQTFQLTKTLNVKEDKYEKEVNACKRMSIPIVCRAFDPSNFIGWDIVNVQTMLGPTDMIKYMRFKMFAKDEFDGVGPQDWEIKRVEEEDSVIAKTRKLKTRLPYGECQDLRSRYNKEEDEVDLIDRMSKGIATEMNDEILTDITNNVGTIGKCEFTSWDALYSNIVQILGTVHRKTLSNKPNWIVTTPKIANVLLRDYERVEPRSDIENKDKFKKVGILNHVLDVYEYPQYKENTILMGYKNKDNYVANGVLDDGYYYCPYIPFGHNKVMACGDGCCWKYGYYVRYGKKLLRTGSKLYAKIEVSGLE